MRFTDNRLPRLASLWHLLGLVFHTKIGRCFVSDHYREIVLPSRKNEWEAKTEEQWRQEFDKAAANNVSTVHTFGALMDADRDLKGEPTSEKLDIWNAGIDHLGMALNLAVQLV